MGKIINGIPLKRVDSFLRRISEETNLYDEAIAVIGAKDLCLEINSLLPIER